MKMRNGFVSNSSSSSFIIQWKCNLLKGDEDINMAMIYLFGLYESEQEDVLSKDWMDNLNEYESHLKPTIEKVIENSKIVGHYTDMFETSFSTSMRNDTTDYGEEAHRFLMALTVDEAENGKGCFEIIHIRTDNSG